MSYPSPSPILHTAGAATTIACNAAGGAITVNLPAIATCYGRIYNIKKTDSSAYAVTIDGYSSEAVDGATTLILRQQGECATIQNDGSAWWIV